MPGLEMVVASVIVLSLVAMAWTGMHDTRVRVPVRRRQRR